VPSAAPWPNRESVHPQHIPKGPSPQQELQHTKAKYAFCLRVFHAVRWIIENNGTTTTTQINATRAGKGCDIGGTKKVASPASTRVTKDKFYRRQSSGLNSKKTEVNGASLTFAQFMRLSSQCG
jgi:hypothetical protein